MRILFVTPYPPSRIRVRGYGFLKQLQRVHEVSIIAQCRSEQELADVAKLRDQGFEVVVVQESKLRSTRQSALALFNSVPLQVAYARSMRFAREVEQLCTQRSFDVVHVEHLRGIASLAHLAQAYPLVWDAVDCISLLCKHTISAGPSQSVRLVARLEHQRTRRYEAQMLSVLKRTMVTSERDRLAMIELLRTQSHDLVSSDDVLGAGISVIPNGVDLDYFRPKQLERRRFNIVFSGKMSYHANVATALYLHQQIMPLIWQQRPEATLTIVGSNPPKALQVLASDPRVEVTGYVDDLRPYISRAEIMLSPMVYSVGIQNKVLEAMALGTPVIVASQAASALGTRPGRDLLVATSAQDFANATLHLMDDADLRTKLSQHGREYVEQQHDWQKVTQRLVDVYKQTISPRPEEVYAYS